MIALAPPCEGFLAREVREEAENEDEDEDENEDEDDSMLSTCSPCHYLYTIF